MAFKKKAAKDPVKKAPEPKKAGDSEFDKGFNAGVAAAAEVMARMVPGHRGAGLAESLLGLRK